MPLIATKRPRPSRAAKMRPAAARTPRLNDLLRDQSRLLRWLLAVTAVAALTAAVEAWEVPFPYRLGDYASDGIAARIAFGRVSEYDTEAARRAKAASVNPIFRSDPAPLDLLAGRLRRDLDAVTAAASLEDLSPATRAAFGLRPPEGQAADAVAQDYRGGFETLRANLRPVPGSGEDRVAVVTQAVAEVASALRDPGVLTADEFKRIDEPGRAAIDVLEPADDEPETATDTAGPNTQVGPDTHRTVPVRTVLLGELMEEKGPVGRRLANDPRIPAPIVPLLRQWLRTAPGTLVYDDALTKAARRTARESVAPVENRYNPRDILVDPGSRIDESNMEVLRAEYDELERAYDPLRRTARVAVVALMVAVLVALYGFHFVRAEQPLFRSPSRLAVFLAAVVLTVAAGRFLSFDPWRAEVIPLTATAMVSAIVYGQMLAVLTAFGLAGLLVLSSTADLSHFVVLMSVCGAAIIPLSVVDSRSKLIKVGFLSGVVYFVVSYGLGALERQDPRMGWADTELLLQCLKGAGWCLVSGYLVAGSLPFIESLFGVVTDISLLEMSDVSHPLLQELVRRAPGTYNHSMAVASIGETAADSIGANGLLLRVGAYFHDCGKMLKPHYFIENMTEGQKSRHDQLNPAMSTLIIIGHVKDGVDLARDHNLPRPIVDFIEQHHGTTLVEYFYREASRLADLSLDHKADAEESAFRYPGPKPQSKEAAVMMLSDAVESASRTLSEPTPKRIENLVHALSHKRLMDGQFDESGMTLSEVRLVEKSLIKSLIGIYHGRIKYPDQKNE